eukprot:scaffold4447_cov120-Cylindrotheca_fusiformis.AAC.5
MNIDEENSTSRKRVHPDSASVSVSRSSTDILALVENPNFEELARHYPSFQKAWNDARQKQKDSKARKSFSSCVSQEFTVTLTRGLLHAHFNLQLPHLESNHLCPPVPNRFFYLHWIETCLLSKGDRAQRMNSGIDIGTGSTCIYALLAARFFGFRMVATEIDRDALDLAKLNVAANQLDDKIFLLEVAPSHSQQPSLPPGGPVTRALTAISGISQNQRFDIVMTNPPFYDPAAMEHCTPRVGDGRDRTSMTVSEGSYPNGEVGFVTEMIADSLQARQSAIWFSSMLGKKTSLVKLKRILIHLLGPGHVETTEYGPGQYTRWFIAWTFRRPSAFAPAALSSNPSMDRFEVVLDGSNNAHQALNEVASRISVFCQSSPGGWHLAARQLPLPTSHVPKLMLQVQESSVPQITSFVDESESNIVIPPLILDALQGRDNSEFLPPEGHFVIQVLLEQTMSNEKAAIRVNVQLACYRHSSRGLKAVEKIRSSIEGEVARTNRKWRRIRQRQ